jgi:hypothetical protein
MRPAYLPSRYVVSRCVRGRCDAFRPQIPLAVAPEGRSSLARPVSSLITGVVGGGYTESAFRTREPSARAASGRDGRTDAALASAGGHSSLRADAGSIFAARRQAAMHALNASATAADRTSSHRQRNRARNSPAPSNLPSQPPPTANRHRRTIRDAAKPSALRVGAPSGPGTPQRPRQTVEDGWGSGAMPTTAVAPHISSPPTPVKAGTPGPDHGAHARRASWRDRWSGKERPPVDLHPEPSGCCRSYSSAASRSTSC